MKKQDVEFITLMIGGKTVGTMPKTEATKNLKSGGVYEIGDFKEVVSKDSLLKSLREYANTDLLLLFEEAIISNTTSICNSRNIERCSGKTRALLYLAIKYDLPLVVATNMERRNILSIEGVASHGVSVVSNGNGQKYIEGMDRVLVDDVEFTSLEANTIIGILK